MTHKHGRGKKLVKRMSRIMKESHQISQRLATEQARKELKDAENRTEGNTEAQ